MLKLIASVAAITLVSGVALAQSPAPSAPASPSAPAAAPKAPAATPAPATTAAPAAALDAAGETRFKSADKNNNGVLDGAEVESFKANMVKIDADKDGKISRAEFASALKGGVIK
jgi:hypothetical protein